MGFFFFFFYPCATDYITVRKEGEVHEDCSLCSFRILTWGFLCGFCFSSSLCLTHRDSHTCRPLGACFQCSSYNILFSFCLHCSGHLGVGGWGAFCGRVQIRHHPSCRGILLVFRCCGRQLPDEAVEALLFLLLLLLFLDPQNSEQAAAGAAPLLREGGREERLGGGLVVVVGGMSVSLNVLCSRSQSWAAVQTRPHQGAREPAGLDQFHQRWRGWGDGGGVHSAPAHFSPRWRQCCCHSRARLRPSSLLRWSFKSLMSPSRDGELNPAGSTGMENRQLRLAGGRRGRLGESIFFSIYFFQN